MFRYLLNFWFPIFGLFFAAGTTIGVDAGGGDVGDGGDGGGDADPIVDSGGEEGDGELGDASDEVSADAEGEGGVDPNAPVDLGDGRQVPGKFKKLFDLAKKAGVEKEAKQLYFAQQRLLKAIPGGINSAIQLARDIEEMGGVEGVQQLRDDLATHTADAELFENNQAKWVETAFGENSEAALKAFDHSLTYVAEKHPEHYDHRAAGIIISDLNNLDVRGIHGVLAALKDNPEAARLAKQLADYYNSRLETSKQAPEKKPDAKDKALTEREQAVKKQEMTQRYKEVNTTAHPFLKSEVTKVLKAEAKLANLDLDALSKEYPTEWRNMLNEIQQEIMKAVIKDQRFIDKYAAVVEKGDLQRATKAINDKHAQLAPDIARKVMQTYATFRGKKAQKPGDKGNNNTGDKGTPQAQGWTRVSKRPENSAINWGKTTSAMQLDGKYILNDGKKVVVAY